MMHPWPFQPMLQSRSGCSFPREAAPRRARRSRFWGCRVTTSRSATRTAIAWRGSRGLSESSIIVRACGTIRPGSLRFIEHLLAAGHFDVLLPIHEQGFLFARVRQRLERRAGLALPHFASYRAVHGKAGFSRLLDQLRLPQPATRIVTSATELRDVIRFPAVVKTSVGTASRGVWFVRNDGDLDAALRELGASGAFADEVRGAGFCRGRDRKGAGGVLPMAG